LAANRTEPEAIFHRQHNMVQACFRFWSSSSHKLTVFCAHVCTCAFVYVCVSVCASVHAHRHAPTVSHHAPAVLTKKYVRQLGVWKLKPSTMKRRSVVDGNHLILAIWVAIPSWNLGGLSGEHDAS